MPSCDNCFFGGKQIGNKGDPASPFVIVGESPGAMELGKGIPFVGPTGKLLDEVVIPLQNSLGIDPFVTNAISCMPRQKDPSRLAQACRACNSRLIAEIDAHPRKVILALGNAALWSLTGNYNLKITQVRGQTFLLTRPWGVCKIVACVHPAFLLRGGGSLQQFQRDIFHAFDIFSDGKLEANLHTGGGMKISGSFKPGKYEVVANEEQMQSLVIWLKAVGSVYGACDTETENFNPRAGDLLCSGISLGKDKTYVIPRHLMTDDMFNNDIQWVWQNGKYDMGWLRHHGFTHAKVDSDTMLLSYALNERGGVHDLEQIGNDWLQAPNYKNMLEQHLPSKKSSYGIIPKDVLYEYQAIDAELTLAVHEVMHAKVMADPKLARLYNEILIPASEFLYQVESYGIMTDPVKIAENEEKFGKEAEEYERLFQAEAERYGIKDINPRSWQQVGDFLYGKLRLAPIGSSTDAQMLERLEEKHSDNPVPALKHLLNYRKVQKLMSTFVTAVKEKTDPFDGRIHTTFKLHGTTTGRLSSNTPNLQNIPRLKAIRNQFIAPPGKVILDVDLSQAELRMLACLSEDQVLCDIFRSGISPHDVTAMKLFGAIDKEKKIVAKCINFGIIYGITASGIVNKLETDPEVIDKPTRAEAQEWIDVWYATYPEAAAYIDRCRMAPIKGQTMVSAFGRKRRFGVVSRESLHNLQNEAANFPHQSGAHDIALLSGIRTQKTMRADFQANYINEVHDNLLAEMPNDLGLIIPAAKYLCQTMMEVPKEWGLTEIPFLAEAQVGTKWEQAIKLDPFKYTDQQIEDLRGKPYETIADAE